MFRRLAVPIILLFLVAVCSIDVYAKNLYVSSGGSDEVSYESNTIDQPWRTPAKAWYNARPGDTVYFRGGTYPITEMIDTMFQGYDGTAENPIRFTNYNNEAVELTSGLPRAVVVERNYNYVEGLTLTGDYTFFHVGYDTEATHFKLSRCKGTLKYPGGAVNRGVVVFQGTTANNAIVEHCTFSGPGAAENPNTAGVFISRTQGIVVRNCEFENLPQGICFQHTAVDYDTGTAFTNNYFHNCDNGINSAGIYTDISNNLFVNCGILLNYGCGLGDSGLNNGGDHNRIVHNTFYNGAVNLWWTSDGDGSGCKSNTIKDNIFMLQSKLHEYSAVAHATQSDYNLYPTGHVVVENEAHYSLPAWQSHSNQDVNSLSADPVFAGGNDPLRISDFAITPASPGYQSASDGKDIGAGVFDVGPCDAGPEAPPEGVYVSCGAHGPMGDDDAGTGEFENPYRTIQKGIDALKQKGPGHVLYLRGGTYTTIPVDPWDSARRITFRRLNDATSWENAYTIRSYPGEWAVIDASQYTDDKIFVLQGTDITGGQGFIEISHLEIKNAYGATHCAGISTRGGPYRFRYLYIHDNICGTGSNNPAGLQLDNGTGDSVVEYCCFYKNGYMGLNENSANIVMYSDYKYSDKVDRWGEQKLHNEKNFATARHNNTVRYCLVQGGDSGGRTSVGIKDKAVQFLASNTLGDAPPVDENNWRTEGNDIHHNIVLGHQFNGIYDRTDFDQIHHNIVQSPTAAKYAGIRIGDATRKNRSPWELVIYNNTTVGGRPGIDIQCSPKHTEYFVSYWVNNNIVDSSYDYDSCQDITLARLYTYPIAWDVDNLINVRNNYFYRPRNENLLRVLATDFTLEEANRTPWASDNASSAHDPSDPLYSAGPTGACSFIPNPEYSKIAHIVSGGTGGDHPYLEGVRIPSYLGAVNPHDSAWVAGVMSLGNTDVLKNAGSGDPEWIERGSISEKR